MKCKLLLLAAGTFFLPAVIALAWTQIPTEARAPMKATGVHDHGLVLIGASDPNFDGLVTSVLRGRRDAMFELFKPFSVVLHNTTDRGVVGYALVWEFTDVSGRRIRRHSSYSQPASLLDGRKPRSTQGLLSEGLRIGSHSHRLLTPHSSIGPESSVNPPLSSAERNPALDMEIRNLSEAKDLEVSLDGAFFEDGTFVGPNRSGFFEIFRADFDARQDLMSRIVEDLSRGKTIEQISHELEASIAGQGPQRPGPTVAEVYQYSQRLYAEEFLGVRRAAGDEAAKGHVFDKWFRNPPRLVRK